MSTTDSLNRGTGAVVTPPHPESAPAPARPSSHRPTAEIHPTPGPSVYIDLAGTLLPRWLRLLGPAPWLEHGILRAPASCLSASMLYRQQAATLAMAILCELDGQRADRAYLAEFVRASLVRWQLSLRSDGRPARRSHRQSPLCGVAFHYLIQLLSERSGFQTALLLKDIENHGQWLARRPPQRPWIEAATVCALVDCAPLIRDPHPLKQARRRLEALLALQDEEGWFPERGGADIGLLSLTIDALARLYRQSGWAELKEPLHRALRLIVHFVQPDGSVGGCYNSCDSAFVSPLGLELLADEFDEAASLAVLCRRRCAELPWDRLYGCDDTSCAVLGASVALAGAGAPLLSSQHYDYPYEQNGVTRFPRAGLSIFSTASYRAIVVGKKGGAIRVAWRDRGATLDDPGITVVYQHGLRTSGRTDPRTRHSVVASKTEVRGSSVTCGGILRRIPARRQRLISWIKSIGGRIRRAARLRQLNRTGSVESSGPPSGTANDAAQTTMIQVQSDPREGGSGPAGLTGLDVKGLAHDYYTRHITFGDDWIRIQDRVRCRIPCKTIVYQSAPPTRQDAPDALDGGGETANVPLFVDGGRNVAITRVYRNGRLIEPSRIPQ